MENLDTAFSRHDFDADARVGTRGTDLHIVEFIRTQERRVIIESFDHSTDGVLKQLMIADRIDVVVPHTLHDFCQQSRILPGQRGTAHQASKLGRVARSAISQDAIGDRER
jgi:hypothetical protein